MFVWRQLHARGGSITMRNPADFIISLGDSYSYGIVPVFDRVPLFTPALAEAS